MGKKYYQKYDFLKGFWQLLLAEECWEILSYMTDVKIYSPKRVPQGAVDSALFFQQTIETCLQELLLKSLLVWIDDLLVYANSVEDLLKVMERLYSILDKFGFKLSIPKCKLFLQEVKWCGRIFSESGVKHDPIRIEGLCNMPPPSTAGELQQFLCAVGWMRDSIPDYARIRNPLQVRLEKELKGEKKTKRIAAGINLRLSDTELLCFEEVKKVYNLVLP